jgi:hypothetical protein
LRATDGLPAGGFRAAWDFYNLMILTDGYGPITPVSFP